MGGDMSESSRVATLVGLFGLVFGAILGASIDNFLERGRNFEKAIYEKQAAAIARLVGGNGVGPFAEVNRGRKLIALTADGDVIRAIRSWMVWEKSTEAQRGITEYKDGKMHTCANGDPRIKIFSELRKSMRARNRSLFDWLPWIKRPAPVSDVTVWEVFVRCLPATE